MKTATLTILVMLGLTINSYAAKDRENGDTLGIRQNDALSMDEIESYLDNNGKKIKNEILLNLINNTNPEDSSTNSVQDMYRLMLVNGKEELKNEILLTPYRFSPDCEIEENLSAQTTNENFSDICFNLEYIIADKTNLETLVGLVMHEHAHHYGVKDEQYKFASFFQKIFTSGSGLQPRIRIFSGSRIMQQGYYYLADPAFGDRGDKLFSRVTEKMRADQLCQLKGYSKHEVYYTSIMHTIGISLWVKRGTFYYLESFDNGTRCPTNFGSECSADTKRYSTFFTSITCIR